MLPESALKKYVNMEYNNEHHNLHINGKISTLKTHQFQYLTHLLLHQQMEKGVHYLVQYTRRSSIQIDLKLNQELLGM